MGKAVQFYYDYGSPAAYLAWTQLPALCRKYGAELICHPVLLGGIFKATDNRSPVTVEKKGAWMFDDMERHADRYGVPFARNPYFIINTLPLMRGAMWARANGRLGEYDKVMFEAIWVNQKDMNDVAVIGKVLTEGGFDAGELVAAVQEPDVKGQLIEATEAAVSKGLFGVPTMILDGEMHFGQDRLDWIERALAS
ncbi:MAG: 2-hydroxychromene-2-carboxylate isomerase [Alphaproteobacteria bacterium]|nr:2-hydroxychromene-2-carboxylate isomerase [Alphaproteobacteria bacterium]